MAPSFLQHEESHRSQAEQLKLELESSLLRTGVSGGGSVCFFLKDNLIMTNEILIHIVEILEGDFEYFTESDAVFLARCWTA